MKPSVLLLRFVVTLLIFLLLDSVWLGVIADGFYQENIGHMLGPVNWAAAIAFYLLYIAGILYFAVIPSASEAGIAMPVLAAKKGAVLGLVSYGTYDLTNLATLDGWPLAMVAIDLCWGTVLTATVSGLSSWFGRKWQQ